MIKLTDEELGVVMTAAAPIRLCEDAEKFTIMRLCEWLRSTLGAQPRGPLG